jgi:hypothetical protein
MEWYGRQRRGPLGRVEGDIEPLYVELLMRWWGEGALGRELPARLEELIEWRLETLSSAEQRVLQAIAVEGACSPDTLDALVPERADIREALPRLKKAGLITTQHGEIALEHALFGRVALARAPRGVLVELHTRAAEALAGTRRDLELRAYHAIRGRPGPEAFALVEESVRMKTLNGDQEGRILALWEGLRIAREEVLGGEIELISTCIGLGQKLAEAMIAEGRLDEASGVLHELLDLTGGDSAERALVLEQLATVADQRGRPTEAESARRAAQRIHETATSEGPALRSRVDQRMVLDLDRSMDEEAISRPPRSLRRGGLR